MMERLWLIVATLCMLAAALLLWRAQADEVYGSAAFVAATLGVVAWFLRLRTQLRKTLPPTVERQAEEDDMEETEADDEN